MLILGKTSLSLSLYLVCYLGIAYKVYTMQESQINCYQKWIICLSILLTPIQSTDTIQIYGIAACLVAIAGPMWTS